MQSSFSLGPVYPHTQVYSPSPDDVAPDSIQYDSPSEQTTAQAHTSKTALPVIARMVELPIHLIDMLKKFAHSNQIFFQWEDINQINSSLSELKKELSPYLFNQQLLAFREVISLLDLQGRSPFSLDLYKWLGKWFYNEFIVQAFREILTSEPKEKAIQIRSLFFQLRHLTIFRQGKWLTNISGQEENEEANLLAETFYNIIKLPFGTARRLLFDLAKLDNKKGELIKTLFLEGRLAGRLAFGNVNPFLDIGAYAFFLLEDPQESEEWLEKAEALDRAFLDNTSTIPLFYQWELIPLLKNKVKGNEKLAVLLEEIIKEQNELIPIVKQNSTPSRAIQFAAIIRLFPIVTPLEPAARADTDLPMKEYSPSLPQAQLKSLQRPLPAQEKLPDLIDDDPLPQEIVEEEMILHKTGQLIKEWVGGSKRKEWPQIFKQFKNMWALSASFEASGKEEAYQLLELLSVNLTRKTWTNELRELLNGHLGDLKESFWQNLRNKGIETYFVRLAYLSNLFDAKSHVAQHQQLLEGVIAHFNIWHNETLTSKRSQQAATLFEELWPLVVSLQDPELQLMLLISLVEPIRSDKKDQKPVYLYDLVSEKMQNNFNIHFLDSIHRLPSYKEMALCKFLLALISSKAGNYKTIIKGLMLTIDVLNNLCVNASDLSSERCDQIVEVVRQFLNAIKSMPVLKKFVSKSPDMAASFHLLALKTLNISHKSHPIPFPLEQMYDFYIKLLETNYLLNRSADDYNRIFIISIIPYLLENLFSQLHSPGHVEKLVQVVFLSHQQGLPIDPKIYIKQTLQESSPAFLHASVQLCYHFELYSVDINATIPLEDWEGIFSKLHSMPPYEGWLSDLKLASAVFARQHYKYAQIEQNLAVAKKILTDSVETLVNRCAKGESEEFFIDTLEILELGKGISREKIPFLFLKLYLASKEQNLSELLKGILFARLINYGCQKSPIYKSEIASQFSQEENEIAEQIIASLDLIDIPEKKDENHTKFFKIALIECFRLILAISYKKNSPLPMNPVDVFLFWMRFIALPEISSLQGKFKFPWDRLMEGATIEFESISSPCPTQRDLNAGIDSFRRYLDSPTLQRNPALLRKYHKKLIKSLIAQRDWPIEIREKMILELFSNPKIGDLYVFHSFAYKNIAWFAILELTLQGVENIPIALTLWSKLKNQFPFHKKNKFDLHLQGILKDKLLHPYPK